MHRPVHIIAFGVTACALVACGGSGPSDPGPGTVPVGTEPAFRNVSATHLPAGAVLGRDMDAASGDIDSDGDLDLIVAVEFGSNLLLENDGSGRFTLDRAGLPGPVHDSEDIALTDLDADGDLDLVFVSEDDRTDEMYLNSGDGLFTDATSALGTRGTSNAVEAVDLDGDGLPEILIGNAGVNRLLWNVGDAQFEDRTDPAYPGADRTTQDLELGDIDGDGDLDLIEANEDGNRVLVNDGSGHFTDETDARFPPRSDEETREAELGDIDGDGDLDLILANVAFRPGKSGVNRALVNDGNGFFSDESVVRLGAGAISTVDVELADLDGDGDLDLIEANFGGSGYRVLTNDGDGRFADATPTFLPGDVVGAGVAIELFDADGDGRLDLFLTHYQGGDHLLLRND